MMLRLSLVVFLYLGLSNADVPPQGCGNKPSDIVFVLDESGSIYGEDFTAQLRFVKELVGVFDIQEGVTHVGVVTFDHTARDVIQLGEYHDKERFNAAVDRIRQHRGSTDIYKAINMMRNDYFLSPRARSGVPRIGIVITDGMSDNRQLTIHEADLSRKVGVTMFAVGVGQRNGRSSVNYDELRGIANKPSSDYMFSVNNYDALNTLKKILAIRACEVTTVPPPTPKPTTPIPTTTTTTPKPTTPPQMIEGCRNSVPLDVVFSIPDQLGVTGTEASLNFIKKVSKGANISPKLVQVGIAPQFFTPRPEVELQDNPDPPSFKEDVNEMMLNNTHLERVLSHIRTESFSQQAGARTDAIKYAVVFLNNNLADRPSTHREANLLKRKANLIMVGVGKRVGLGLLQRLATIPRYALAVKSWDQLNTDRRITDALKSFLCDSRKIE